MKKLAKAVPKFYIELRLGLFSISKKTNDFSNL